MTVTTMMLPSRSVRNRRAMSPAPRREDRAGGSDGGGAAGARVGTPLSVRTSLMRPLTRAYAAATPGEDDVPSYRLFVSL